MNWLNSTQAKLTLTVTILGILGMGGYSVKASLPPSRTEVQEQVTILRDLIDEAKTMTATLALDVQTNTDDRLLQRWKWLMAKRANQGLNPNEQYELCQISAQINFQAPGCA